MGRVAPGVEVCVLGATAELPDGAEGELSIRTDGGRGSWIFAGYKKVDGTIDTRRRNLADGRCVFGRRVFELSTAALSTGQGTGASATRTATSGSFAHREGRIDIGAGSSAGLTTSCASCVL